MLMPGELVGSRGSDGVLQDATVVKTHNGGAVPYYTVLVDGRERSAERERLVVRNHWGAASRCRSCACSASGASCARRRVP